MKASESRWPIQRHDGLFKDKDSISYKKFSSENNNIHGMMGTIPVTINKYMPQNVSYTVNECQLSYVGVRYISYRR